MCTLSIVSSINFDYRPAGKSETAREFVVTGAVREFYEVRLAGVLTKGEIINSLFFQKCIQSIHDEIG